MMRNLWLVSILLVIFSCQKKEPDFNELYHEELVKQNLSKDSLEKMNTVFEKLNKHKITYLDYFYRNYYQLENEVDAELKKQGMEKPIGDDPKYSEKYFDMHHKMLAEKIKAYNQSMGITGEEEQLIEKIYFNHLKPLVAPTIDSRLKEL